MGKKPQRHTWAEAMERCRLNRDDVEMAKRLGFRVDSLIRAIPGRRERWKLPVNEWVRCLYEDRFGAVLGKPLEPPAPIDIEIDEEALRRFGEELYWEDYWERNSDETKPPAGKARRSGK